MNTIRTNAPSLALALFDFDRKHRSPPWGVIGCHTPLADVVDAIDRVLNFYSPKGAR